ncbi:MULTISPECIES: DUF934 domain-containing protein [unclassified Saccharibacter]|uniref:DUF934 domain-containing protein n=1 Tax=unclassified Saccharibacter TaxID=2648722 RepID=UPI001325C862|nr:MULTISPECIES: DUF934 domain-containing protein [unclassified Saccharibacter]MXV36789.1 DUF934 domain-containing protein [Saccharibacter sp. EH611]MXV58721.1 DUF934 domain-containing protein [Saccharibacter sp. EH70]MXV66227.1 DUF934 domain-containing protein [Saccharibacter sp. EH60]
MKLFNLSQQHIIPAEEADPVSLAELKEHPEAYAVALEPDESVEALRPFLAQITLVVLHFPIFRDGRAFTQARSLREYEDYKEEIRVTGHVLPDQAAFLRRCGVDTVVLSDDDDQTEWEAQLKRFTITYQQSIAS